MPIKRISLRTTHQPVSAASSRHQKESCDVASRKSAAVAIVRAGRERQMPENTGGKGGTRTLDPGIMSRPAGLR